MVKHHVKDPTEYMGMLTIGREIQTNPSLVGIKPKLKGNKL
jgi:hypothetical protein